MTKLIALKTLWPGPVAPGQVFGVDEQAEAELLVDRGFARPHVDPAQAPATSSRQSRKDRQALASD